MNVLEKTEKALEYLKSNKTGKNQELTSAASTLGRGLGVLGSRASYTRHYSALIQTALPALLELASHENAEIRLVGDEVLNRAVVGGVAFHSHKCNIVLQNSIELGKNARWTRAALNRICLGTTWLRPGTSKIRVQAQTLFPKLSLIVQQTDELQIIVESLENNLVRILDALSEFATDEELCDLTNALLSRVECAEPAIRRSIAFCVAHLCLHRDTIVGTVMDSFYEKLWPLTNDSKVIQGWFTVAKMLFHINSLEKLSESNIFDAHSYMELYQLCLLYIEQEKDHNTQNCLLECLSVLLSQATNTCKEKLLDAQGCIVNLDLRQKGVQCESTRNSYLQSCLLRSVSQMEDSDQENLLSQLTTPRSSIGDLTIQTPESQSSSDEETKIEKDFEQNQEKMNRELAEKLENISMDDGVVFRDKGVQINIGSLIDEDISLNYCARLIVSKFLLSGSVNTGISDRSVRVSVKASALNCLSEICRIHPRVLIMYLDKDCAQKNTVPGIAESLNTNLDAHEYVLERNICYQDSMTESLSLDLLCSLEKRGLDKSTDSKLLPSIISNTTASTTGLFSSQQSTDLQMKLDHFDETKLKSVEENVMENGQVVAEVFVLYEKHSDPQIRGLVRLCVASYLGSILDETNGCYGKVLDGLPKIMAEVLGVENLVKMVLKGVTDEIHSCVNQTLQALSKMSVALSISPYAESVIHILNGLSTEITNYYLCKVNLCMFYRDFDFERLFIIDEDYYSRTRIIRNRLFGLLSDNDQKVRIAAAETIASIIPKIYTSKNRTNIQAMKRLAQNDMKSYSLEQKHGSLELVKDLYYYYDTPDEMKSRLKLDDPDTECLKAALNEIVVKLMESNCSAYTHGLLETLYRTCVLYPPWNHKDAYTNLGILEYCVDKLDYCNLPINTRTLLNNICSSIYPVIIQQNSSTLNQEDLDKPWSFLRKEKLRSACEKYQITILRCLNVLMHLFEELNPTSSGKVVPGSPVRRSDTNRKTDILDEKLHKKRNSNIRANFVGNFNNEPFYMKLYENLRAAYSNYKINLDQKSTLFNDFLTSVLNCLIVQLEMSTEKEFGHITEEILYYLKVTMTYNPTKTVHSVTQLLKCLFSTNVLNNYKNFKLPSNLSVVSVYEDIVLGKNKSQKLEKDRDYLLSVDKVFDSVSVKNWTAKKKELERYIRLSEPVVIQAIKNYTMQNDIPLQCVVLALLHQLLLLKLNYCMLDSDQIFIGFLMKQLDLVEQREIPNCCNLVSNIMQFLVQLSSAKHHTKQIIEVPKLIQLCDGLLAAGALNECVMALQPLAIKTFRTNSFGLTQQKEIMAAREVIVSMLHKCVGDYKVLNLISCILILSLDNSEDYYRLSEVTCDSLLISLQNKQIQLDNLEAVVALANVFDCLHDDIFIEQKRVENVLKLLFLAPPEETKSTLKQKLIYLNTTLILLKKYISKLPEDNILHTIQYLKPTHISPKSLFFCPKSEIDPLNVSVNENCASLPTEVVFVRFLFKTLSYAIGGLSFLGSNEMWGNTTFNLVCLVKEMMDYGDSKFPVTYETARVILRDELSGLNTGLYSPDENIPLVRLNRICLKMAYKMPLLTMHWAHLLIRLNFLEDDASQKLIVYIRNLPIGQAESDLQQQTVDVLQVGCTMAFCEYFLKYSQRDAVHLTWLIVNRIHTLIAYYKEEIVKDFIEFVHKNASASGLLLQAVAVRCNSGLKGEFALNMLKVLENCHETQVGALVFLLCRLIAKVEPAIGTRYAKAAIEKCRIMKNNPELKEQFLYAVTLFRVNRYAKAAIEKCRIMKNNSELKEQLSKDDLQVLLDVMHRDNLRLRYPRLVKEVNSLASIVHDLSPLDLCEERTINPHTVHTTVIDDQWLVNELRNRCCGRSSQTSNPSNRHHLATILSNLTLENLTAVMSHPDFDRTIYKSCFDITTDTYLNEFNNNMGDVVQDNFDSDLSDSDFDNKSWKEAKSQFFVPVKNEPKLVLSEDVTEITSPLIPDLYKTVLTNFDRDLTALIKTFPKQNRPLSQSENYDLSLYLTSDKYSRRCQQVFQDKLFYKEFVTIQTVLTGVINSFDRIETFCQSINQKSNLKDLIPHNLFRNISIFSVISLQYMSFLIKNKSLIEHPIQTDVSFKTNNIITEKICIFNILRNTLECISSCLQLKAVWKELNNDNNINRKQSAISCLYTVVKFIVKDTKPLTLKEYSNKGESTRNDATLVCDKMLTLIEYWETNFYSRNIVNSSIVCESFKRPIEIVLAGLARLDITIKAALIPPIAWSGVEITIKDGVVSVDLPLQALEDLDVLEGFLFRVNLMGWSTKKQFEEIWVALLSALQGNGPHRAIKGIEQLLTSIHCKFSQTIVGRSRMRINKGMLYLNNILVGTNLQNKLFSNTNLEQVPLTLYDEYHFGHLSAEYLKYVSGITSDAPWESKLRLRRDLNTENIDLNSCLQLLMDITSQMLDAKSPTGLSARVSILSCIITLSDLFSCSGDWSWLSQRLVSLADEAQLAYTPTLLLGLSLCVTVLEDYHSAQELTTVHDKLLRSLTSSYAPLRQAALHGFLLQLSGPKNVVNRRNVPYNSLLQQLGHQLRSNKISPYEQSLYWALLFTLIDLGQADLMKTATDFILDNPTHYCSDLVVKGITSAIRNQVLPKDIKNLIINQLLDNRKSIKEEHYLQILTVHLFSAVPKLLHPKQSNDLTTIDPDLLMAFMERIGLLYDVLRDVTNTESILIIGRTIDYFLKETLTPSATLSRVVKEFVEMCVLVEKGAKHGVFAVVTASCVKEVFDSSLQENQLTILTGWLFEALCHLLTHETTPKLMHNCLTFLLISASANKTLRVLAPLCFTSFCISTFSAPFFKVYLERNKDCYLDKKLLCSVVLFSGFSQYQLEKLIKFCSESKCLIDVSKCLTVGCEGDTAV